MSDMLHSSAESTVQCPRCPGDGVCAHCRGTGEWYNGAEQCDTCKGSGRCPTCWGRGKVVAPAAAPVPPLPSGTVPKHEHLAPPPDQQRY